MNKQSKTYKILSGAFKDRILNTSGCLQTVRNKVYGYIGWTPYLLSKDILKEI